MALNRGPFNALVDDDGTGKTGTPWNKQAIKDVILDPVDALVATPWTQYQVAVSGTDFPDWNPAPGIVGNTIIYIAAADAATITIYGLKPAVAATPGQRILIHLMVAPPTVLNFYHTHPGASPNCGLNCRNNPLVSVNGYWAFAEFQYGVFGGVGGWMMGAYGNGIGGTVLRAEE